MIIEHEMGLEELKGECSAIVECEAVHIVGNKGRLIQFISGGNERS